MPDTIGYQCDGCGEQFLYREHDLNMGALRAVWDHIEEEHNGETTADTVSTEGVDA